MHGTPYLPTLKKKKNLPGLGYARIMQVVCILVKAEREIGCIKIHC